MFFSLLFLSLLARFAWLQFVESDYLIYEADRRSINKKKLPVLRGVIKDRDDRVLAASVIMYDVWADPKIINEQNSFNSNDIKWKKLAEVLNISVVELASKLNKNSVSPVMKGEIKRPLKYILLKKAITADTAKYIKLLHIKGIDLDRTTKRFYPYGAEISQLIGLTDKKTNNEEIGIDGIERRYNDKLSGEQGYQKIRGSLGGRVIEEIEQVEGVTGGDIVLSIDVNLQSIVYNQLKNSVEQNNAESGIAVLVAIDNGEILAMASYPSFNPNNRTSLSISSMKNKAVTDAFEPGSTIKPFLVAAALEQKVADEKTVIDTRPIIVNGSTIKDVNYSESLDLEHILVKSSNVGVSQLAFKMDPNFVASFYARFGFGVPTALGLNGESAGVNRQNRKRWVKIEQATYAYGYGLMTTPLQLARAYATLGSYGKYRPVSIMKVNEKVDEKQVISPKIAKTILKYMESVAEQGENHRVLIPNYRVGIKTGTAKKIDKNGKYENKYIAYTVGIAPISQPKYALVVVVDDPSAGNYYGGSVSAPIFANIMGSVLRDKNVTPDRLDN